MFASYVQKKTLKFFIRHELLTYGQTDGRTDIAPCFKKSNEILFSRNTFIKGDCNMNLKVHQLSDCSKNLNLLRSTCLVPNFIAWPIIYPIFKYILNYKRNPLVFHLSRVYYQFGKGLKFCHSPCQTTQIEQHNLMFEKQSPTFE